MDFDRVGLDAELRPADDLVQRPGRLLPRRLLRLLVLARRARGRRHGGGDRLRLLGRARAAARVLRPHALPDLRGRRRLRLAGPAALLRLLRGDDDPALRPDRRLGRAGPAGGDGQVRHLHDGGLAAHARRGHRLRALEGLVRPRRHGHEQQHLALPRLRDRVRGQGAALPVPRLAAGRLPRVVARGRGRALGRDLEGGDLRLHPHLLRQVPRAVRRLPQRDPRARGRRPRLRIAPGLPRSGHPRRDRVLEPRADGPDHDRRLRREHRGRRAARSCSRSTTA